MDTVTKKYFGVSPPAKAVRKPPPKPRSFLSDADSARLLNLVAVTAAGFRTTFGCEPERCRGLWDENGKLVGAEAEGDVAGQVGTMTAEAA